VNSLWKNDFPPVYFGSLSALRSRTRPCFIVVMETGSGPNETPSETSPSTPGAALRGRSSDSYFDRTGRRR
jgi:hypothetical protein